MSDYQFSYDDIDSMLSDASSGIDIGSIDVGGLDLPSNYFENIGGLDLPGEFNIDPGAFSFDDIDSMLKDASLGEGGFGIEAGDARVLAELGKLSDIDLTKGVDLGGLGLTPTGRGQMSIRDPETGATGITGEGFTSIQDLLGSGTAEEIARYTPGSVDYFLRSGLETPGGLGMDADATRGMGLKDMGGGQGISLYKPAEYGGSVLEDLIDRMDPKYTGEIQDYLNKEIFGGKGLTPFKGTGGTLSESGFLSQSSKANPYGAKYAIGDPKSRINDPSVTGQQATVSPGKTVINNRDGTLTTVTDRPGGTTKKTTPGGGGGGGGGRGSDDSGLGALLPFLLMMLLMNQNKGGGGSSTTIPGLTATQKQTPYTQQQRAPGYRPGQGGITYFEPTQYAPKMAAGGGISRLLQGPGDGVSDSIPAVISNGMAKGGQPAKLARGEYVIDARTVAALGNGSTDAGAERLDKMRKNILRDDRKAGVGKDSKAYRHLMA